MLNNRIVIVALTFSALTAIAGTSFGGTVTVTGVAVGQNAAPNSSSLGGDNIYHGDDGVSGYIAPQDGTSTYVFTGATLTGGIGSTLIGTDVTQTYQGGYGGNGILSQFGSSVTPLVIVNSGTYTGGMGGSATGNALQLIGGGGGSGLDVNNSTAIVNGGTFIGGAHGTNTDTTIGSSSFNYSSGPGLNANSNGVIVINGGTFQGGADNGDAILGLNGNVSIYGGTFIGGGSGLGIDVVDGSTTVVTLYGSDFEVNGVPTTGLVTGSGNITGILQNNGVETLITFSNRDGTINLVAVPEPASMGVLVVGGMGLLKRRTRRA